MANPLTAIRTLLYDAIRLSSPVVALLGADGVQMFNRAVDVRGNIEELAHLGRRVWIVRVDSETDFDDSSASVGFRRVFEVGFAVGTLLEDDADELEYAISRAMLNLSLLRRPDDSGTITQPSPLFIESLSIRTVDAEREPLGDPEEWRGVCEIEIFARGANADLKVTT